MKSSEKIDQSSVISQNYQTQFQDLTSQQVQLLHNRIQKQFNIKIYPLEEKQPYQDNIHQFNYSDLIGIEPFTAKNGNVQQLIEDGKIEENQDIQYKFELQQQQNEFQSKKYQLAALLPDNKSDLHIILRLKQPLSFAWKLQFNAFIDQYFICYAPQTVQVILSNCENDEVPLYISDKYNLAVNNQAVQIQFPPDVPCSRFCHLHFSNIKQVNPLYMKKMIYIENLQIDGIQLKYKTYYALKARTLSRIDCKLTKESLITLKHWNQQEKHKCIRYAATTLQSLKNIINSIEIQVKQHEISHNRLESPDIEEKIISVNYQ